MIDPRQSAVPQGAQQQQLLSQIVNGPFPKIYFNGFALAAGATDLVVILQNGEHAVTALQANYSVLKEFAGALAKVVDEHEKQLGVTFVPLIEASQRLQEASQAASKNGN